ncbi:MAG TPA: hypothetical protein VHE35_31390 [Kofleriaceae bacterium]|nr:hypothetical protein [Kofleriaceae bacterium]
MTALALCGLAVFVSACPKNVPQDLKSGEDAKPKGAKPITLDNNEGTAKGIVTYPGGDRVDWKVLELPKDATGQLTLKLKWTPPRPGLDLSFDVLNEWNREVASAKPNKRKHSRKTTKQVTVDGAKGKYYIAIYASERGDAGKYTLSASFAPNAVDTFDWLTVPISDPPKLPAVPEPLKPCDPKAYDAKNPACAGVCPEPADPKNPACAGICPTPPDENIPACLETMPCPNPPDVKFKKCTPDKWPPCNPAAKDMKNPNCLTYRPPDVIADITDVQSAGDFSTITIGAGSKQAVDKGWTGVVLDSNSKPVRGGGFTILSVTSVAAVAKVKLGVDTLQNAKVRLSAPMHP